MQIPSSTLNSRETKEVNPVDVMYYN